MRIAQKKQAEEFVELLGQAHEEIRSAIEKKNIPAAMSLLADCQDGAIALGDLIENAEGEGAATIPFLEGYCELVYGIHQGLAEEMEGGNPVRADKAYKTLRQGHIRIANSIAHDVEVRREVVFLPYKASMWDSLESVWKAADEDPGCDAYVIPIPYYDKNPDGSFRELHYEGGEYPKDVPVVWYEDYDFEKRRPDMIFIHNPYDDCNIVTSVHPFFYSKNLKKFTEKLVYIPYFILGEIDPENRQELEGIEKFCLVPGVAYADQVVVQSEDMRQAYINVLTEFMSGQGRSRAYWEKKILGLGSPKVDKVLSTRKEDLEIPEEWMRVIRKADGSWKKIIFYNTTVTALLQHNEQYLEKMRDVFRVFYENRDEVALLWRPHPLFGATIQSMRPELGKAYREIVESYKRNGWGIYDDSSELDRAVVLSDGYYGDWSSVACLYKDVNKSIMVQNVFSLPRNNYSLAMDNIVEHKGEWWFLAMKDNGIYKMKKETLEASLVRRIPYRSNYMSEHPQYGKIHFFGNKIFIIPMVGNEIAVYDMEKDDFHYIKYGESNPCRGTVFAEKVEYRNKLYLIPCGYDYIVCLDLETEQVRNIAIHSGEKSCKQNFADAYAWGSVFFDGENVMFTKITDNKVICVNLESESKTIYECDLLDGGGSGICGDENCIWIIPKTAKKILCWDRHRKHLKTYDCFPKGYEAGEWSFHKIQLGGELYLLPREANMCIAVNKRNGNMRKIAIGNVNKSSGNFFEKYMYYTYIWNRGNQTMLISSTDGKIITFDEKGSAEEHIIISWNNKETMQGQYNMYERQNRQDNLINFIRSRFSYEDNYKKGDFSGFSIYSKMKGEEEIH
jgi:hypothetical protein